MKFRDISLLLFYAAIAIFSAFMVTSAQAQTALERCQEIKNQLDYLRIEQRRGGSSQHLNRLRKEKHRLNKHYSKLQCYRIRTELK